MPFTLAHPAAVVPLRRFCPRVFDFAALVIGSLAPDAFYLTNSQQLETMSHQWRYAWECDVPLALGIFLIFFQCRKAWNKRTGQPVAPGNLSLKAAVSVMVSLVVGIATHLLFDSFTHKNGLLVQNWMLLQEPLLSFHSHTFRVCNLLWYLCSFLGIAVLYLALATGGNRGLGMGFGNLCRAAAAGALLAPVGLVHHLIPGPNGLILVTILSAPVVAIILLRSFATNDV